MTFLRQEAVSSCGPRFVNRPTTTGGKKYDKFFVYVPAEVAKDSQFPFKPGDEVEVRIDARNGRIVVMPT
jgi:Peptidase A4 family